MQLNRTDKGIIKQVQFHYFHTFIPGKIFWARSSEMTQFSSSSALSSFTRRKANQRNSEELNAIPNSDNENASSATFPSRIPIKSPARSSKPIGGMTIAYSPIKSTNEKIDSPNSKSNSNNSSYSKKLIELKNAMDLLKTPPAATSSTATLQPQSSYISYTPIKSSGLVANNPISPFASAIDAIEISMASSSDTETAGNDTSLLDAYHEDDSHQDSLIQTRNSNIFSSPQNSMNSSPYISSEELKKRLEATKEAFQKSLEAQKHRLRASLLFNDVDSSFSTCGGFDSDLSIDSLKSTRDKLEKIKKEVKEIVESDFEDVKLKRNDLSNDLIKREAWTWSSILFKYFVIFTISTIIFVHFFVNYFPALQLKIFDYISSFEKENFLNKVEEALNFLLNDE